MKAEQVKTLSEIWPTWFIFGVAGIIAVLAAVLVHSYMKTKHTAKYTGEEAESKIYLYPVPVRIWHWSNAILFLVLLITGFLSHFGLVGKSVMKSVHGTAAMLLIAAWVFFVLLNIFSLNGKHYIIKWKGFIGRCFTQGKYYISGIMEGEKAPFEATNESKFNPVQQITYVAVVYLMIPSLIFTGMFIRGSELMKTLHLALSVGAVMFLTVHVYLCISGAYKTQILKAMIDGHHRTGTKADDREAAVFNKKATHP